jgi:hypothetical protein
LPVVLKKYLILYFVVFFLLLLGLEYFIAQKFYATGEPYLAVRSIFHFFKLILIAAILIQIANRFFKFQFKIGYKTYLFSLMLIGVFSFILSQSNYYYHILKISKRGWVGDIYQSDELLGYQHTPNFDGFRNVPYLPQIPVQLDESGNRIIEDESFTLKKETSILFLGCSFTFGDACATDETFAFQTGAITGYKSINAGVCGYGLTQMFLKAQELLPKHQPTYTVVQYSPWIVDRAMYPFSPNMIGKVPTPMARVENDSLIFHAPVFKSLVFKLPIDSYILGPASWFEKMQFAVQVGIPLVIYDTYQVGIYRLKEFFGKIKLQDFSQSAEVASAFYQSFQTLCEVQNSQLVVLVLGHPYPTQDALYKRLLADERIIVVNADEALWSKLNPKTQENYDKTYKHWSELDGQPIMVDEHPNAKAHRIIAEEIVQAVTSDE